MKKLIYYFSVILLLVGCTTNERKEKEPLSDAVWVKGGGGKITQKLNSVSLSRKGTAWVHIEYDPIVWPSVKLKNGKSVDAWVCVFALRDGRWIGGPIEQCKVGDHDRDLKNEDKGDYLPGVKFKTGEKVLVCLIPKREDIHEMSNSREGVWP